MNPIPFADNDNNSWQDEVDNKNDIERHPKIPFVTHHVHNNNIGKVSSLANNEMVLFSDDIGSHSYCCTSLSAHNNAPYCTTRYKYGKYCLEYVRCMCVWWVLLLWCVYNITSSVPSNVPSFVPRVEPSVFPSDVL